MQFSEKILENCFLNFVILFEVQKLHLEFCYTKDLWSKIKDKFSIVADFFDLNCMEIH